MLGLYFSGTGNTKHCVQEFINHFGDDNLAHSIESQFDKSNVGSDDIIVFGYPVYFSNIPKIVKDYISNNSEFFKGKKIFIIATMGLFSGDGAGCSARLFKKCGAKIIGGLHLKMPDCINDVKILKKSIEENKKIINQANLKIASSASRLKEKHPTKEGLNALYHLAGLLGQRLWFYGETRTYKKKPNINTQKCTGCGICSKLCPMQNLKIINNKAESNNKCTLCYRCLNNCKEKAITILGKNVHQQTKFEDYQK